MGSMFHSRSFWTGLSAIALAGLFAFAGMTWISADIAHENDLVDAVNPSEANVFIAEAAVNPTLPTSPVAQVTSTRAIPATPSSATRLQEPPLAYLLRVKGEPRLTPEEVAVRLPILMYHRIRPMKASFTSKDRTFTTTPEAFEAQMRGLKAAGYTTVTPRDLEDAIAGRMILPEKSVLLTFDDGYREHYTRVLPILRELNLKATYFIISQSHTSPAHMTNAMIREADESGLITIAAHSRHHVFLARSTSANRTSEILGSKQDLEDMLGHEVKDFAYPFGSWSQTVADETKAAGYHLGFGIRLGAMHGESSRYQLRRIRVLDRENVVSILDAFSKP